MKITFIGATHEVTGSCTLIEIGTHKLLVDYGMEQGRNIFENVPLPVNPAEIECVFLTHAHIDHSGYLPLLYKNGFKGNVYATEATTNLCKIMLRDSAHIQEFEAEWRNRKGERSGKPIYEPLYTMEDAEGVLRRFIPNPYGRRFSVLENVDARFGDVGHLLGSACVELWLTENGETKKIVFSGDVGNIDRPIIRDPQPVDAADYVVLESTYGNREHEPHEGNSAYVNQLAAVLQRTFDRGGNVVIPSFAVGRTQELLYFIREIKSRGMVTGHDGFKVFVDSPLAVEATSIFVQCEHSYFDDEMRAVLDRGENPIFFPGLEVSVTADESKAINFDTTPKVILSASGMCEAGRIRHHLKHNLWRPESTILFVGYQAEGTLGRAVIEGADRVKLFGEEIAVRAEIATLAGISGHADRTGLTNWLTAIPERPALVFINHGEDQSCMDFAEYLHVRGYVTEAPYSGSCFDLLSGECLVRTEGVRVKDETTGDAAISEGRREADRAYAELSAAAAKISELARAMQGRPNKELRAFEKELSRLLKKWKS